MMQPPTSDLRFRIIIAIAIGAVAAAYARTTMLATGGPGPAADFTYHWLGARALVAGKNPYLTIHVGEYGFAGPYVYPITSSVIAIPLALLSSVDAAAAFVFVSSALLAFGVTRDGFNRLPLFLSTSFLWAANSGQLSPLIAAAAVLPAVGFAMPIKPNLGIAAFIYRPSKAAAIGSLTLILIAFSLQPHWFADWLRALTDRVSGLYFLPLTYLAGPVILLAGLRWRLPEARLLLALAVLPQSFLFYDALLLWLIPRTWKESLLLTALSWVALELGNWYFVMMRMRPDQIASAYFPLTIALVYLPCVIMVLRRPDVGELQVETNAAETLSESITLPPRQTA